VTTKKKTSFDLEESVCGLCYLVLWELSGSICI